MFHKIKSASTKPISTVRTLSSHLWMRNLLLLLRYFVLRAAGILFTIATAVFIVVLIMNQDGFIDQAVYKDANNKARSELFFSPDQYVYTTLSEKMQIIDELTLKIADQKGINFPYWQRHLLWTWNMLTFNWGDVEGIQHTDKGDRVTFAVSNIDTSFALRYNTAMVVAQYFPNTLLVVGVAYVLIFSLGLPLAINLSRHYNSRLDRFLTALAPLSSVPSWVYGILLVGIFAFQLHWLPAGGKYDLDVPEDTWSYIAMVARHMILPVLAIILSMIFQFIYVWRTYFILFSMEDYVELAIAQGLPARTIERKYILRPSLPYILTNFVLSLAGFWQITTALEYFFNWPGIGWMYFRSLLMDDLIVSIAMVVIFAYILGAIVLVLDIVYLILDPRIQYNVLSRTAQQGRLVRSREKARRGGIRIRLRVPRINPREWWQHLVEWFTWSARPVLSELRRYPSALAGTFLIAIFLAASVYAMIVYPYSELESIWNPERSSYIIRPELARPEWFNWFLVKDLPENQILDSRVTTHLKQSKANQSGGENITITYTFTVPDGDFPQSVILYFHTQYNKKAPFTAVTWTTPDGREFKLNNKTATKELAYDLTDNVPNRYVDGRYQGRIYTSTHGGAPRHYVLFAVPSPESIEPLAGTYQLRLDAVTFEPESDFDAELVILGQVYGWAGTDHLRRELSVGLLWGLPVALGIGMLGALTTSLFAMLIAAASAWVGGWVDSLSQRLTEVNMMLPILAIGVLLAKYFHVSIWTVLLIAILLNAFGSTTRAYRAAFLQIKESPYIESARAYGASDLRIITHYMIPRVFPVMIPQVVMLIPGYVFLEATLAIFGVSTPYAPTWGRIIFDAVNQGALRGDYYWVLEPIVLLLFTSLAFAMLGFALDRVLNPRLRNV